MKIANIHHEITEARNGADSLNNVLFQLVQKINDLEYRLSYVDRLPYPARDENGELRYDTLELAYSTPLKEKK